jgi:hypothetical protein
LPVHHKPGWVFFWIEHWKDEAGPPPAAKDDNEKIAATTKAAAITVTTTRTGWMSFTFPPFAKTLRMGHPPFLGRWRAGKAEQWLEQKQRLGCSDFE